MKPDYSHLHKAISVHGKHPPKSDNNIGRLARLVVPSVVLERLPSSFALPVAVCWLASRLQVGYFLGQTDKDGWMELHSAYLRYVLGTHRIKKVVGYMVHHGLLEVNNSYHVGVRCKKYRLKVRGNLKWITVKSAVLAKKMEAMKRMRKPDIDPYKWMSDVIEKRMSFFHPIAWNMFDELVTRKELDGQDEMYWRWAIMAMENGDYHFAVADSGRFFSNVTNLPKQLRPLLQLDNKDLWEIDIRCCQPMLLATLYADASQYEADEHKRFLHDIATKDFYTVLHDAHNEWCNDNGWSKIKSRDEIKKDVFKDVLFDRVRDTPMWAVFATEYPELSDIIVAVKNPEHNRLALLMQKTEADIMMNGVVAECQQLDIPVMTVHDSVLCKKEHVDKCKELITASVKRVVGIEPVLRVTPPNR